MKTIFISAYHVFISRNIFNTEVLRILQKQLELRLVIFAPPHKKEFLQKYYGSNNTIIEGFDIEPVVRSAYNKFWYRLGFLLENSRYVKDQRGEELFCSRNLWGYLKYAWISLCAVVLSRLPLARSLYRFLDLHFSTKDCFSVYFEKYRPDLVFATDMFGEHDVLLMREARHDGVPVVGMVRSWDNTTTKGVLRLIPERIIASSPVVKSELVRFHSCRPKNIIVVGLPQFDSWIKGPTLSREEFFKQIGLDPAKRLVLFAPAGQALSNTDWQLCQILKDALASGALPANIQFLVRNHPHHPADLSKFTPDEYFIIEVPGQKLKGEDYKQVELSPDDASHLLNSVYYSDIVIYVVTTLGLDATVFNKPQVMVNFDGWESRPYFRSVKRYNQEDCLANLTRLGGTRVVENKEVWIKAINDYLADSRLDEEGRKKAITEHMYKLDGRAGQRIAQTIMQQLYE